MWDVVVIGAGPAGLSAALTLNHLGVGVLLLDPRGYGAESMGVFPFDPVEAYRKMITTADSAGIVPILEEAEKIIPLEGSLLTTCQGGEIESKCVIIACGGRGLKRFADAVDLTADNRAAAGEDCRARTPGVFVCGDARSKPRYGFVTALSDGAVAAAEAAEFFNHFSTSAGKT